MLIDLLVGDSRQCLWLQMLLRRVDHSVLSSPSAPVNRLRWRIVWIVRLFSTFWTPRTWEASSPARSRNVSVSTTPVRYTVRSSVLTPTRVKVASFSSASLVLTAAVIEASSKFSPAVLPVMETQPPSSRVPMNPMTIHLSRWNIPLSSSGPADLARVWPGHFARGGAPVAVSVTRRHGDVLQVDQKEGRAIGNLPLEEGQANIVDGHLRAGPALEPTVMGVPMENHGDRVARERLLQSARAEKWIDSH